MKLQAGTIKALDVYWTTFFACSIADFGTLQTLIVPHAALGNYHGIFVFRRSRTLIISVPSTIDETQHARLAVLTAVDFDDPVELYSHIPLSIDRVIGPAFIGYADKTTFQPCVHSDVRLLRASDEAAWRALRAACPAIDWEHGGSAFTEQPLAGCFREEQLVALAGYEHWGTNIAHIAVVTHPAFRSQGYGKGVVSWLSENMLEEAMIPQYRTLRSNTPSLMLAADLGFVTYAESIALRLA